ncbi:MAG: class II aldolase and adducin N-terminal domain-containing protein [Pseudomonadota bacterium]
MNAHANITHWAERVDMAAAFRWSVKLNLHEAVSNHFSLAVNPDGSKFLMNPNMRHFGRITASSLLEIDANDPSTMNRPDAPDPTAWGLHGSIHRALPHARCVMHVHSIHATVLASLADSYLPPIDQNSAMFFGRQVVDADYGGMAFEEEAARCVQLLADPKITTMIMGNHGVLIIGQSVADAFNRLTYFERAAETYIRALQTGRPLRILSDAVAEKTAGEWDNYPGYAEAHLREVKALLDEDGANYAS